MNRTGTLLVYGAIALLGAGLGAGCSYFNTFYNAKTAWNAAVKLHDSQPRVHPDSLVAPTGEALRLYDRAWEKAAKVLEVFPNDPRWHDDAVFLMGNVAFRKGEYARAIRVLRRFQEEYPHSPHIPQSWLLLGQATMLEGNLDRAEEILNSVLADYPSLNNNDEVSLLLARIAIARQGRALALELLEEIRASVRSVEKRIELTLQIARLHMDLKRYQQAIEVLQSAPRRERMAEEMFAVDVLLLEAWFLSGNYDKALQLSRTMLDTRRYGRYEGEILNWRAKVLRRSGEIDEAMALFERVTRTFDSGSVAGEAWLELGLLYQHARGDLAKARECFEKAAGLLGAHPDGVRAAELASSLVRLEELHRSREQIDSLVLHDTAWSADTLFTSYSIGELFWLELEQPDSALGYFLSMTRDTSLDSSMLAKALYASAWITLAAHEDTARADSLYRRLVALFPEDEHSKRAQIEREWPRTVQTPHDRAYSAFVEAEKMLYDEGQGVAAANAFLQVYRSWPDFDIAPRSLHAAAWILDEHLHRNETARRLYQRLCDEYPDSPHCLEWARPRIGAVIDTLEALRQQGVEVPSSRRSPPQRREGPRSQKQPAPDQPAPQTLPADEPEYPASPQASDARELLLEEEDPPQ